MTDGASAPKAGAARLLRARLGTEGGRVAFFAFAYAGSAAVQKGLGFLLFMWLAQHLTVEDYARFGLLYALQTGVAALALAGVIEAAVGGLREARTPDQRRHLLNSVNLVFAGMVAVSMIVVPLAFAWSDTFTPAGLVAAAIAGGLTAFFVLQAQLARIIERHVTALVLGFVPALAGLVGGALGVIVQSGALGFFVGSAIGLVIATPLALLSGARLEHPGAAGSRVRYITQNLAPFVLVAAIDWFMGYGSTYLVKLLFTTEVVARFVFAYTLSSIMHLVATSMNQAWSPRVFRLIHSEPVAVVERGNRKFYALQGGVIGMAGALILIGLPLILNRLANMAPYRDIQVEVFLLFAAYAAVIPWYHAQNFFYAHAQGRGLMWLSIGTSVIGLLAWFAAATTLGPIGAYAGFFLMFAVKAAGGTIMARRQWGTCIPWQGPAVALGLLGAGLAASLAWTA